MLLRTEHLTKAYNGFRALDDVNPDSIRTLHAFLEPSLRRAGLDERFQFERHGYFCLDPHHSKPGAPVFNRTVTLRDSWAAK